MWEKEINIAQTYLFFLKPILEMALFSLLLYFL